MSESEKINSLIEYIKGLIEFCEGVGNSEQKMLADGIAESARKELEKHN